MTTIGLSVKWRGDAPIADISTLPIWELCPLAHEDFTDALANGFEKAGDPEFNLHWSGTKLSLSSVSDLTYMANDLIDFGRWLCWPIGSQSFALAVQGFEMRAVATDINSVVNISADWKAAYRTPVASLANRVSVGRSAISRDIGVLLRQLEQMLLADKLVYVPLSWVCRYIPLSEAGESEKEEAGRRAR